MKCFLLLLCLVAFTSASTSAYDTFFPGRSSRGLIFLNKCGKRCPGGYFCKGRCNLRRCVYNCEPTFPQFPVPWG